MVRMEEKWQFAQGFLMGRRFFILAEPARFEVVAATGFGALATGRARGASVAAGEVVGFATGLSLGLVTEGFDPGFSAVIICTGVGRAGTSAFFCSVVTGRGFRPGGDFGTTASWVGAGF